MRTFPLLFSAIYTDQFTFDDLLYVKGNVVADEAFQSLKAHVVQAQASSISTTHLRPYNSIKVDFMEGATVHTVCNIHVGQVVLFCHLKSFLEIGVSSK